MAETGDIVIEGKSVTGEVDISQGNLKVPYSATLPATCTVGQIYMHTDAVSGRKCYLCESTDTWVLQGDGAGGGSGSVTTVSEEDTPIGGADIVVLDFEGNDFSITEPVDTKINISIDYTNGQAAATGVKGFLTGTDWDTFNSKEDAFTDEASLYSVLVDVTQFLEPDDAVTLLDGTPWRFFYTNADGTIVELALDVAGTYLKSNGIDAAPTFDIPAGAGTMASVKENGVQVGDLDITTLDFLGTDFAISEDPDAEINISIDYTNGQAAASGVKGFLTGTDWDTFNGKESALTDEASLYATLSDVTQFLEVDDYATLLNGTAWRVLYTNASGDVTELPFGAAGTYLKFNGTAVAPSAGYPPGSGDVTGVGDCLSGDCLDGTSDGGTYVRLYDGDSHYLQLDVLDLTANKTINFPTNTSSGNALLGVNSTNTALEYKTSIDLNFRLVSPLYVDGTYSGMTCNGVLGATAVFGDLVYLSSVDQRWKLADADVEATSGNVQLALVLSGGVTGETKLLLLQGYVREDDWNFTSYGKALFVGLTAGDMVQDVSGYTTGDIVRVVGYAGVTADQIYFNPCGVWLEK